MSSNQEHNDKTIGQRTGSAIDTSVSWLGSMWNRHATKFVLLVLLIILIIVYRREVSSGVSSVVGSVSEGATSAYEGAASAVGFGPSQPVSVTVSGQLPAMVSVGELNAVGGPTASDIRELFRLG